MADEWLEQVDDPAARKALLALYEAGTSVFASHDDVWPPEPSCGRCGHGRSAHRVADVSSVGPDDVSAMFRCVYPASALKGPPVRLCDCHDFVEPGS